MAAKSRKFWFACQDNDIEVFRELIKDPEVDINWRDDEDCNECTPLHIAIIYGNKQVVVELLQNEADPNTKNENGGNPLMTAARMGNVEMVKQLLANNARINEHGYRGCTALHMAAKHAHVEVLKILLEAQANTNLKNKEGNTPLHLAAIEGHPTIIQLLLAKNADTSIPNDENHTALREAKIHRQPISKRMLESKYEKFWSFCQSGDLDGVKKALDSLLNINWQDDAGYTGLHRAINFQKKEVAEELLSRGADATIPSEIDETPLITAASIGDAAIVKLLLEDVNVQKQIDMANKNGEDAAVHKAASYGHMEVLQVLIEKRADLNKKDKWGNTPLHLACREGNSDVVELLMYHKVHIERNKDGKTPKEVAEDNVRFVCVGIFEKRPTQSFHPKITEQSQPESFEMKLWKACSSGDSDFIQSLPANISTIDDQLKISTKSQELLLTPLVIAVQYGHIQLVNCLLQKGANPNAPAENGLTPLMMASKQGEAKIVQLLLNQENIDINAESKFQETALHMAVKKAYKEVVELLVQNNADIEKADKHGNTPLHLASKYSRAAIAMLLVNRDANKNAVNQNDETPKDLATGKPGALVKELLDESSNEADTCSSLSLIGTQKDVLLWKAVQHCNEILVDKLLLEKADPNWENPQMSNYTSLQVAVTYDQTRIIHKLLDHNANPNKGMPPSLLLAAKNGGLDALLALLQNGAYITITDTKGNSALHIAAETSHQEVVDWLCYLRLPLDKQNEEGDTALHLAARKNLPHITKLLLSYGARRDLTNKAGEIPFNIALRSGYMMVLEHFMDATQRGGLDYPQSQATEFQWRAHDEKYYGQDHWLHSKLSKIMVGDLHCGHYQLTYTTTNDDYQVSTPTIIRHQFDYVVRSKSTEELPTYMDTAHLNMAVKLRTLEKSLKAEKKKADVLMQERDLLQKKLEVYTITRPDSLPEVEVFAETRFEMTGEKNISSVFQWKDHGLKLHLPARSTANFTLRAVWSNKFVLPDGVQLVSAVYWVSTRKRINGSVEVELQHCCEFSSEEHIGFAVCKVIQEEPPYIFELHKGKLGSSPSYMKMEIEFCNRFVALYRNVTQYQALPPAPSAVSPVPPLMFFSKIYYYQTPEPAVVMADIVTVPKVEITSQWFQQKYNNDEYVAGPSEVIIFEDEKITFEIEINGELNIISAGGIQLESNWKIERFNTLEIYENELVEFNHNDANARILKLTWLGDPPPQRMTKDIYFKGSRNHRFLTMSLPPVRIGPPPAPRPQPIPKPPNTHPINKVDHLIYELVEKTNIINPKGFGMSLGLTYNAVDRIAVDNPQSISEQLTKIAVKWFQDGIEHTWEEVVEALCQHELVYDSEQLAKRRGVVSKH